MSKKQVYLLILTSCVFLIYALPYLFFRQDSVISPWDNLDSYFVWYKVLSNYGWYLPLDFKIPEFLCGTSRNTFHSELIFQVAIFNILTPLKAYITIDLLGRIIGFLGMFLLLKDFILKDSKDNELLICGLSLCFAFIPNMLILTFLTILGQPLWLWAFLNIRKGNYKYYNWLVLTLMPFCVNFELVTPFFLFTIGCIWLYDLIAKKKFNPIFLFSIFYCGIISLITIYRFIYLMYFDKTFVSHRLDWNIEKIQNSAHLPLINSISSGIKIHILNNGERCANPENKYILLYTFIFAFILGCFKKAKRYIIPMISLFLFMTVISIIYGIFFYYKPFQIFLDNVEILRQFQFSRFYFFMPTLWVMLFALSVDLIKNSFTKFGKYIVFVLIIGQIIYLFCVNSYFSNTIKRYLLHKPTQFLTYKEYLSEEKYRYIKNFIGEPQNQYKVAVIGELSYNVPAYNGFHTINGYFNLYSLEHKRKLNQLNKNLIENSPTLKIFLVYWGHQQFIYWSEYYFDTNVMRELGVKYLFSDRPIQQKNPSDLYFLKIFPPTNNNGQTVYLYKLLDKK